MEKFIKVAKEAAVIGGLVLKEFFRKVESGSIEEKAEKDFVSFVDRTSEERIREYISKNFPDHCIVGEERGGDRDCEYVWFIDPLDGTKNYLAGFPIFGTSVGLQQNGREIVGAVYLPFFDHLYWAGKGEGAFKNGRRIHVNGADLKYSVVAYGFPSRARRDLNVYWRIFSEVFDKVAAMRRPGAAAVDLCFLAEGVFGGLVEFELHQWDISAGKIIVEEAGGIVEVIDYEGKKDVIASNGKIHGFLKEVVLKHLGVRC